VVVHNPPVSSDEGPSHAALAAARPRPSRTRGPGARRFTSSRPSSAPRPPRASGARHCGSPRACEQLLRTRANDADSGETPLPGHGDERP